MTLAQAEQILDRGDDSSPSRAVVDRKSPGEIGLRNLYLKTFVRIFLNLLIKL